MLSLLRVTLFTAKHILICIKPNNVARYNRDCDIIKHRKDIDIDGTYGRDTNRNHGRLPFICLNPNP